MSVPSVPTFEARGLSTRLAARSTATAMEAAIPRGIVSSVCRCVMSHSSSGNGGGAEARDGGVRQTILWSWTPAVNPRCTPIQPVTQNTTAHPMIMSSMCVGYCLSPPGDGACHPVGCRVEAEGDLRSRGTAHAVPWMHVCVVAEACPVGAGEPCGAVRRSVGAPARVAGRSSFAARRLDGGYIGVIRSAAWRPQTTPRERPSSCIWSWA
jgi:hypothetical protein